MYDPETQHFIAGYGTPGVEWNEHGHFVGADSPEFQYAVSFAD